MGRRALLFTAFGLFLMAGEQSRGTGLSVVQANNAPARMAQGPEGKIYVTDPEAGSVFIYDSDLNISGQLKNLNFPLGIAVGVDGRIYAGCQGSRSIQVYDADGGFIMNIAEGELAKPNDIALDLFGNLYVVDSSTHRVRVYNMDGGHLGDIGSFGKDALGGQSGRRHVP